MKPKNYQRYLKVYAGLIGLYPKAFKDRFSEPMLQTFGDMVHERSSNGENIGVFTSRMCLETFLEICKERFNEVVISMKKMTSKTYAVSGLTALLLIAFVFVLLRGAQEDGTIPPNSTIEQARKISEGINDECLMNSDETKSAVAKTEPEVSDEVKEDLYYSETLNFDGILLSQIIDVPAGTQADVSFNSFDGTVAKGSVKYYGGYGSYNYEMTYLGNKGKWELTKLKACQQP